MYRTLLRACHLALAAPLLLAVLAFQTSNSFSSSAPEMIYHVTCAATGKTDSAMLESVCSEMIAQLAVTYPQHKFERSIESMKLPGVAIVVSNATAHGIGLKLVLRSADGRVNEGPDLAFSVMDRTATQSMRSSLYRRVIAATPIPE